MLVAAKKSQLNKETSLIVGTTAFTVEECNSDKTNVDQKVTDGNRVLKSLCWNNLNKLVFAHLNINSNRNKFELISEQVRRNVDLLMISETKTDDSFLIGNVLIHLVHHIGLTVIQKVVQSRYTQGKIFLETF